MYSKTNLIIGIDSMVFTVDNKIVNEDQIRPLRQLLKQNNLKQRISKDGYDYIISNNNGIGVASISNYYNNNQDITMLISLHGIKQVYNYKELQREHIVILNWLSRYNKISIKSVDTSYDNLNGYDKTITIRDNKTNVSKQHNYDINYTSGFRTHHIYIPIDNDILIKKIKSKIIDKEKLKYKKSEYYDRTITKKGKKKIIKSKYAIKGNYLQYIYKEIFSDNGNILIYPSYDIEDNIDNATHIDLVLTEYKSYFTYLQIIEDYIKDNEIEIEYKQSDPYSINIYIKKPQSADKSYTYDKDKRDSNNENKEIHIALFKRNQAKRYKTTSNKIRLTRYEDRKVFNLKDTLISNEDNNIDNIFNLILNEILKKIATTKIYIFKTKDDVSVFKKHYDTDKRIIPLNKLTHRQLKIKGSDIEKALNEIKKHLTYDEAIEDEPMVRTMTSNEIDIFLKIDNIKNKKIMDNKAIEIYIRNYGIKYIEEIRNY